MVLIFVISHSTTAQIVKGWKQLGGVIGVQSSTSKNEATGAETSTTYVQVNPSIGKFYANNRVAGVDLIYFGGFNKDVPDNHSIGGGVFLRQYKPIGKSNLYVFLHERATLLFGKFFNAVASDYIPMKSTSVALTVVPGMTYAVTRQLQVDLLIPDIGTLQYIHSKPKDKTADASLNTKQFTFRTGISENLFGNVSVGVRWLFK
jgi:hypothetical protein